MNIFIVPNLTKDEGLKKTRNIAEKLLSVGHEVFLTNEYLRYFDGIGVCFGDEEKLYRESNLIVVPGGDGSIIRCARQAAVFGTPIIGVNLGRLGYLAQMEYSELDMFDMIIDASFNLEHRMMLDFTLEKNDGIIHCKTPSLNDIVLTSKDDSRVVDIKLCSSENNIIASFRGDGAVVSTPTGSTAYALSAGGPVIDSKLDCISVVPICPHSLTARPILFSAQETLVLLNSGRNKISVTADGCESFVLLPDEKVTVKRSKHKASFIKLRERTFYELLQSKMSEK